MKMRKFLDCLDSSELVNLKMCLDYRLKTDLMFWDWARLHSKSMSARLYNLCGAVSRNDIGRKYISQIGKEEFLQINRAGHKSWKEFIDLREKTTI